MKIISYDIHQVINGKWMWVNNVNGFSSQQAIEQHVMSQGDNRKISKCKVENAHFWLIELGTQKSTYFCIHDG